MNIQVSRYAFWWPPKTKPLIIIKIAFVEIERKTEDKVLCRCVQKFYL